MVGLGLGLIARLQVLADKSSKLSAFFFFLQKSLKQLKTVETIKTANMEKTVKTAQPVKRPKSGTKIG